MKKLLTIVLILIVLISCNGQPKSDYTIIWSKVEGSDTTKLFIWQGADTTSCPFVEDQDYLNPNISNFFFYNSLDTVRTLQLNNDGNYIIVGAISVNSEGIYSGLAKSIALKKPKAPSKPIFIRIWLK